MVMRRAAGSQENAISVSSLSTLPNSSVGPSGLSSKFHTRASCAGCGRDKSKHKGDGRERSGMASLAEAVTHC
jgi:hypothetical protein